MKPGFRQIVISTPLAAALFTAALAAACSSADLAGGKGIDDPTGGGANVKKKKSKDGDTGDDSNARPDDSEVTHLDGLEADAASTDISGTGEQGGNAEADGEADGLDDFLTPGAGGGAAGTDAVKALLDDCGATDLVNAQPDDVIYQKNVTSLPVSKTQTGVTATAQTDLSIIATPSNTTQTSTVRIVKLDGPSLFVKIGQGLAEEEARKNSGKLRLTNVPFLDIAALGDKNKQWDRIACTIVPSTKVEAVRGAYTTEATLDPPAPMTLSPRANGKRYAEEIGDQRVFSGITATVVSTTHPDLQGKTTVVGTVIITKVAADANVDGNALHGDVAYKITVDFGGPAVTNALGFIPEVTYFINFEKKDLVGNIADTKLEGNPVVTFIY